MSRFPTDYPAKASPVNADIVMIADSAASNTTKSATLESFSADLYKYSIVTSVATGNLIVALKNYLGADPSASAPVKVQIGDTVRTVTSALSFISTAGSNMQNLGSAELATKEVDLFVYLGWSTVSNSVIIATHRKPSIYIQSDGDVVTISSENFLNRSANANSTDSYVNIGRFNAILSAGAGYTWSIPATSVIVNRPTFESRMTDTVNYKMKVVGDSVELYRDVSITIINATNNGTTTITYPITYVDTNYTITNNGFNGSAFGTLDETCFPFWNTKATTGIQLYGVTRSGNVGANRNAVLPIFVKGKW